jgi:RNA polymerase sigma-70 factor (ECF subfamily)
MSLPLEALSKVGPDSDRGPLPTREDPLDSLARAAGRGDRVAQQRLCERVAPAQLSVLRAVLGPASPDVADQLQESLVALMQALPSFRGESSVSHFACRIAMKRALDARRRAKAMASVVDAVASLPPPHETGAPSDELASSRLREVMRELMSELPEAQAETLAMKVVLGYALSEIADETRVPLNTVRSRLLLAKKALRERLLSDATLRELAEVLP